jgi:hypothetical protein
VFGNHVESEEALLDLWKQSCDRQEQRKRYTLSLEIETCVLLTVAGCLSSVSSFFARYSRSTPSFPSGTAPITTIVH